MIIEDNKITVMGTFIWLLAIVFFIYEFFLRTFIGTVADQVMNDFSLSVGAFAWVTSAYYFTYGLMQIPVGLLLDKYGVKKILVFATVTCAFSSLVFSHSGNFTLAFISRLIMGFGSSFGFLALLVVVANWFPRKLNGLVSGVSLCLGTLGPILAAGPMVKFLLAFNINWQHLLDLIGIFGFALGLVMLIAVKNKKRNVKSDIVYLENKRPIQLYISRLIKNPQVWFIAIYSGIIFIPMILLGGSWGVPYLRSLGFSNLEAANVISVMWVGYAIGAFLFGGISDKIKRRRPIMVFSAINNVVFVSLMILLPEQPLYFYNLIFLLLGFGSAGQIVAFSAIAEHVDFTTKATALAVNNTSITLLASVTPIIAASLIHSSQIDSKQLMPGDFFNGFIMIPLLTLFAAAIAIFLIKETFCKFQKDTILLKTS